MKNFKKLAAIFSAAAIVTTLSGCTPENGYIMDVDGMPIRTGIYISFQQTSMNNARNELYEIIGDDMNDIEDLFTQSINGKSFSDWVKDDTKSGIKRFVGVQRMCEQYGITLSDDEKAKINKEVQENWDTTAINYYGYTFSVSEMYGYNSMGEYYESQGIGIDSLKEMSYANALSDKLFLHYYGEGGDYEVPAVEIDDYLEENSVAYKLITIDYVDYTGFPVVGDEQDDIIAFAEDLAKQYNDGAKWVDILYQYDLYCAKNDARAEAEEEYEANPPEGTTLEEYVEKAVSEATATQYDDDSLFDELLFNNNSVLSEEVMELITNATPDGKAVAYGGSTAVYIIVRNPVSDFPGWRTDNYEDVITTLRGEEYDSRMELISQNYEIVQKDKLVDGKYSPEKLNK